MKRRKSKSKLFSKSKNYAYIDINMLPKKFQPSKGGFKY